MKTKVINLFLVMMLFATSLTAQIPVLAVKGEKQSEVYLQSLDIQVEVTAGIATTKYTMVFKNRTNKILEGELTFPLPEGVTVSHYALDINGRMREAVPVEKAKATQVFEEIESRRVDPGLLERVEGNNFRTRIYPIPARGTRTISIGYEQELPVENGSFAYKLPMDYKEAIENFKLKATVWKSGEKPNVRGGMSGEITFDRVGENFVAEFARKDYQANRSLNFTLPTPGNVPQVLVQSASGSYYFIASCVPPVEKRKKQWSDRIGIIWDNSLSGMNRDIEKELQLLDLIVKEKGNLTVSLYLISDKFKLVGSYDIRNGNWQELKTKLQTLVYDGGTNYKAINIDKSVAGEFILFSDGLSTLSDNDFSMRKPVHTVVSSAKADYSALKWISSKSGAKFINLNALSAQQLKSEIQYETLQYQGYETNGRLSEVYPSVATQVQGNFSVAGIMDANEAAITLKFGYGNKTEKRVRVELKSQNAVSQGNVYRMWAQKKINELDMRYEKNKEELSELGQQFGIVTRNTSLIVLETLQDYITYNIVPPAELQEQFFAWRKQQDEGRQQAINSLLSSAKAAAKDLKEWWKTDFKPVKPKYPKPDNARIADSAAPPAPQMEILEVTDDVAIIMTEDAPMEFEMSSDAELQEVVVVGFGTRRSAASKTASVSTTGSSTKKSAPVIRLAPLKQDKEYMRSLTKNVSKDYAVYLDLRSEYINTPGFYFDMADWFYKLGDKSKALTILTSIAELEIENASLYRLLGYRLKEYKEYEMEQFICRKVIEWRPMEPQSYRDYALALADGGKKQEALNTLYSVLTQSYSRHINQRSIGVEEVAVTELNQLIAMNPSLSTAEIDNELVTAMPVDIRVVINWNMNSTDIDLHVTDPNGETCYYGHKRTAIGGRISNDITQGYGPEQFMLKKAIKGKYKVFVNYFGDSQVRSEGPSTVMLEIYTNYSDKSQKREVVCLQLSKENKRDSKGLLEVAEFEF